MLKMNLQHFAEDVTGVPAGDVTGVPVGDVTTPIDEVLDDQANKNTPDTDLSSKMAREKRQGKRSMINALKPLIDKHGIQCYEADGRMRDATDIAADVQAAVEASSNSSPKPTDAPAVKSYEQEYKETLKELRVTTAKVDAIKMGFSKTKVDHVVKLALSNADSPEDIKDQLKSLKKELPEWLEDAPTPKPPSTGSPVKRGSGLLNSYESSADIEKIASEAQAERSKRFGADYYFKN